jgi:hypothetical protein
LFFSFGDVIIRKGGGGERRRSANPKELFKVCLAERGRCWLGRRRVVSAELDRLLCLRAVVIDPKFATAAGVLHSALSYDTSVLFFIVVSALACGEKEGIEESVDKVVVDRDARFLVALHIHHDVFSGV